MSAKKKPFEELAPSTQRQIALTNGLNVRHRQLIREMVSGATQAQAGIRAGFSLSRVRQLMNTPLFLKALAEMEANVDAKFEDEMVDETMSVSSILKNAAPKAAESLVTMSESEDAKIKLSSIKDILDRTGHKAPDEVITKLSVEADEGLSHMLNAMVEEKAKEKADAPTE